MDIPQNIVNVENNPLPIQSPPQIIQNIPAVQQIQQPIAQKTAKRGRPPGSKNKPKTEKLDLEPKKRGRPPGSKNKPKIIIGDVNIEPIVAEQIPQVAPVVPIPPQVVPSIQKPISTESEKSTESEELTETESDTTPIASVKKVEIQQPIAQKTAKRGRPPGSKNKPKTEKLGLETKKYNKPPALTGKKLIIKESVLKPDIEPEPIIQEEQQYIPEPVIQETQLPIVPVSIIEKPISTESEKSIESEKYEEKELISQEPSLPISIEESEKEELEELEEKEDIIGKDTKEFNEYNSITEFNKNFKNIIKQTPESIYNSLYPTLNDPEFNIKISKKKEFLNNTYDGTIYENLEKMKEYANKMCNASFELSPHQLFIKNFLSFQTPFNTLLLYHGLGTGKTCSAITVAEENRDYLKQLGLDTKQKNIIVASPNVQENFKLQLFDSRNLRLVDGLWNIRSCTGNKFLKEINPTSMKGLSREKVISQVKKIIKNSYLFLGYEQFGKYIRENMKVNEDIKDVTLKTNLIINKLKSAFGGRLIIIDEIHNIRNSDDNAANRYVANELYKLVKFSQYLNMRLLLLSATPMYNSYKEIIWLLNIMRLNDGRPEIAFKEIFNSDIEKKGMFVETNTDGDIVETGKNNLRRYATGYISYIRGENPYTFPFRIYPDEFALDKTFSLKELTSEGTFEQKTNGYDIPTIQLNGKVIPPNKSIERLKNKLYLSKLEPEQEKVYNYLVNDIKTKSDEMKKIEVADSLSVVILQKVIEALNIVYPVEETYMKSVSSDSSRSNETETDTETQTPESIEELSSFTDSENILQKGGNDNIQEITGTITSKTGKAGLDELMFYDHESKHKFEYKPNVIKVFSPNNIGKYSAKIKSICDTILNSEGIVLIYSFHIYGGIIPMALALEELGFTRYGTKSGSLFKTPPTQPIDAITFKTQQQNIKDGKIFTPAKYAIISGDVGLSPDNLDDLKGCTNIENINGKNIKVIIISKSGTEGLDFKFIRQVHIMEPWYNMNLIEQTIGRAVRNCSHKDLPFEKRNVQIFLHGTILTNNPAQEAADVYLYRLSERKARQIGEVSRVLKEGAIDCNLNIEQINFTEENFESKMENSIIPIILSSSSSPNEIKPIEIEYKIGDKDYSPICDYMECVFNCKPGKSIKYLNNNENDDTYNDFVIKMNTDVIIQKIRDLFKERYFYKRTATDIALKDKKKDLITAINHPKKFPIESINIALTQLIEDKNEFIKDKYGRLGHLVNIGDYYFFQPIELNNNIISTYDRRVPIAFKHDKIKYKLPSEFKFEDKKELVKEEGTTIPTAIGEKELIQEKSTTIFDITNAKKLIELLEKLYIKAFSNQDIKLIDNDWYSLAGNIFKQKFSNIDITIAKEILIQHIIDELNMNAILLLLNYMEIIENKSEFENMINNYLNKYILIGKLNMKGYILLDKLGNQKLYIKEKDKKIWTIGGSQDINYFENDFANKIVIIEPSKNLNDIIGFYTAIKNDYNDLTFKTKKITTKKIKGSSKASRCDQIVKKDLLNDLDIYIFNDQSIDENRYNLIKDNKGTLRKMTHDELCIMEELILRYNNYIKKNNKIWFITPVQVIANKIETFYKI